MERRRIRTRELWFTTPATPDEEPHRMILFKWSDTWRCGCKGCLHMLLNKCEPVWCRWTTGLECLSPDVTIVFAARTKGTPQFKHGYCKNAGHVCFAKILWLKDYCDWENFDENKSGEQKCFPKMSSNWIRELDLWARVIILAQKTVRLRKELDHTGKNTGIRTDPDLK